MAGFDRSERYNEEIKRALTNILREEVKDPRLPEIFSITRVETARDLGVAKVYISAMIDEAKAKDMMKFFKDGAGYLRRELSRNVELRATPELTFVWDRNIEYGIHIAEVLNKLDKPQEDPGDGE